MNKIAVTLPEAIELSGIGRSSFYKLFNDGKLTPRKSGRRTLILVCELESYLKNLPAGGTSDASEPKGPSGTEPPVSKRSQETNPEEPARW